MAPKNVQKVYVVGVGMTKFLKPRGEVDYTQLGLEAATKALLDAGITYDEVEQAVAGYCYGDSTCGQRVLYQLGMTQIPITNVNNNCSTGSTALFQCRQLVAAGAVDCAMAIGFEKMERGSLKAKWEDRANPLEAFVSVMAEKRGIEPAPFAAQIFGNAGIEYCEKYGATPDHLAMIAEKNHRHSALNPYSQFRDVYTLDQIKNSPKVFGPLTKLQCCPTSDGAGCAILASEKFVLEHGLGAQAIEIAAQSMATDSPHALGGSMIELAGADMTRRAANEVYKNTGIKGTDLDVVCLHDCFSANELITYDALGMCKPGEAHKLLDRGDTTYGGRCVVNPSGGLISKGHPLGATGLAQCTELVWQLRGWCGQRQVPNVVNALQHNVGLGGAVVITLYRRGNCPSDPSWVDPRVRFGYNPAVEARGVSAADVQKVQAKNLTAELLNSML
ncbi:thiolase [Ramicandelaber brevisporus]|nr:thiolase [Ramicandelaber brevisporus]